MTARIAIPSALGRGVFGWDATRLNEAYSADECSQAILQIRDDPAAKNPAHEHGSVDIFTKPARTRMDALSWAIFYHQQAAA